MILWRFAPKNDQNGGLEASGGHFGVGYVAWPAPVRLLPVARTGAAVGDVGRGDGWAPTVHLIPLQSDLLKLLDLHFTRSLMQTAIESSH